MQVDPGYQSLATDSRASIPAASGLKHTGQLSNSFIRIQDRRTTANGLDSHIERGDEGRNLPGPYSRKKMQRMQDVLDKIN